MFPFFPDTAYALGGTGGGDPTSTMMGILPLVAMFAIFYFLLIRPQQKRTKEHVIGRDPFDSESIYQDLYAGARTGYGTGGVIFTSAISGIVMT